MACPTVRGDNLRTLAKGLSSNRRTNIVYVIHTTYISVELAQLDIFRAEIGKDGLTHLKWVS